MQGCCRGCLSASNAAPASLRKPSTSALAIGYSKLKSLQMQASALAPEHVLVSAVTFGNLPFV